MPPPCVIRFDRRASHARVRLIKWNCPSETRQDGPSARDRQTRGMVGQVAANRHELLCETVSPCPPPPSLRRFLPRERDREGDNALFSTVPRGSRVTISPALRLCACGNHADSCAVKKPRRAFRVSLAVAPRTRPRVTTGDKVVMYIYTRERGDNAGVTRRVTR